MCRVIPLYPNKSVRQPLLQPLSPDLDSLRKMLMKEVRELIRKHQPTTRKAVIRNWLNEKQVQQKMNISQKAFRQLQKEVQLPYATVGVDRYFDPADVDRELRSRKRSTPKKP